MNITLINIDYMKFHERLLASVDVWNHLMGEVSLMGSHKTRTSQAASLPSSNFKASYRIQD